MLSMHFHIMFSLFLGINSLHPFCYFLQISNWKKQKQIDSTSIGKMNVVEGPSCSNSGNYTFHRIKRTRHGNNAFSARFKGDELQQNGNWGVPNYMLTATEFGLGHFKQIRKQLQPMIVLPLSSEAETQTETFHGPT